MKVARIQPALSSKIEPTKSVVQELSGKIVATSKKSLKSRKVPNSVGLDSDYYVSKKVSKKKLNIQKQMKIR